MNTGTQTQPLAFVGFDGAPDHVLKTDPDAFDAVARGEKTHEIRKDDRGYKVGDKILLKRTRYTGHQMHMSEDPYPLEYTGEEVRRVVSHIQLGYGLGAGWVILSFATCHPAQAPLPVKAGADITEEDLALPEPDMADGTGYMVETVQWLRSRYLQIGSLDGWSRRDTLAKLTSPAAEAPGAKDTRKWEESDAQAIAIQAGFAGTSWRMGPYELAHLLNLTGTTPISSAARRNELADFLLARQTHLGSSRASCGGEREMRAWDMYEEAAKELRTA